MNILGKILVFLNLLFALFVGGFLLIDFQTRVNWKRAYDDLKAEMDVRGINNQTQKGTNQAINAKIQKYVNDLKEEQGKREAAVKEKTELAAKFKEVNVTQGELANIIKLATDKLQLQIDKFAIENKTLVALIEKRDKKVLELEQQKDQYFKEAQQALNERDLAVSRMTSLQDTLKVLTQDLYKLQTTKVDGKGGPNVKGKWEPNPPPFYIKAQIEKVLPDDNTLVEISVGSDQGMAVGQTLEAFRTTPSAKYLGMVQIVEVTAHKSVARLIPSPYAPPVTLKTGDQVASSLKASY